MRENLEKLLKKTDLIITDSQKNNIIQYVTILQKWNTTYNLTSIKDPQDMLIKHIMDSLVVSPFLKGDNFIDVGTGAGLPGIPLAIVNPDKNFTLLDSLGKRIRFLNQVKSELGLKNVILVQSRVEKFEDNYNFDGIISRAFASLSDMITWCEHLISNNSSRFYALKGTYKEDEVSAIPENMAVENIFKLNVPDLDGERHLIVIKKNSD